jgi:hypothetical protein
MLKSKLIAGILGIGALALSIPAMATPSAYSNSLFKGRYSCSDNLGAGSNIQVSTFGGLTAAYTVTPTGWGLYSTGEFVLNASPLTYENPCVFTLVTWGSYPSSYWIDSSGIIYQDLEWEDSNYDACWGYSFTQNVESSLSVLTPLGAATQTQNTSNIVAEWLLADFVGTGSCNISAK